MASQTKIGKAFEYACVMAFYAKYNLQQSVELEESPQLETARNFFFNEISDKEKMNLKKAAQAAVKVIESLEPQLKYPSTNIPLILALQTDSQGQAGDVRDVLCIRKQNEWEIGVSCKHNHHAVKHSRLSDTIDFGKEWFAKQCTQRYFDEVVPIFGELRNIRDVSKTEGAPALWKDVEDKAEKYYVPILISFMEELKRLDKAYPNEIPELLIRYLIGRNDFYKVITDDKKRTTRVEVINLYGTLNRKAEEYESIVKVPLLKMPSRFYHIDFKDGSQNTIEVVCDEGWTVSMRLHNASSRIEPSLKFDVNLVSLPASIHAQIEPWEYDIDYIHENYEAVLVAESKEGILKEE